MNLQRLERGCSMDRLTDKNLKVGYEKTNLPKYSTIYERLRYYENLHESAEARKKSWRNCTKIAIKSMSRKKNLC